jgi:endo-1,4-beta-xylanase
MRKLSRRQALGSALAVAASGMAGRAGAAPEGSLNALARAKGLRFGSAISAGQDGGLANPDYAAILIAECGLLVPENEMKMYAVRPDAQTFDFSRADRIMAFAAEHGLAVRGHNLLWHNTKWLPKWVQAFDFGSRPATAAEALLVEHITKVCRHFGDRIRSWDVVNETIDPATGEMRQTVFTRYLGDKVIDIAFHAARAALPDCQLVYNDYMEWEAGNDRHRAGVLTLLERLKRDGVPIDALGLQSHIGGDSDLESAAGRPQVEAWRRFLSEATATGVDLLITEFDVNDRGFAADPVKRDAEVAAYGGEYLDVTLSFPQVRDVLAWGMVDRFSWLNHRSTRADGRPERPCPYDDQYRRKPLREAIARSLAAAPMRAAPRPASV